MLLLSPSPGIVQSSSPGFVAHCPTLNPVSNHQLVKVAPGKVIVNTEPGSAFEGPLFVITACRSQARTSDATGATAVLSISRSAESSALKVTVLVLLAARASGVADVTVALIPNVPA